MFSEAPKMFEREFWIAFLLPAALFIASILVIRTSFLPALLPRVGFTSLSVLAVIFGAAVLLLAVNRELYRLLMGVNPFRSSTDPRARLWRLWRRLELGRFRRLRKDIRTARRQYRTAYVRGRRFAAVPQARLTALMSQAAEEFPDCRDLILPTRFGNIIKAFEVYPRAMYGIGGNDGMSRLLAVIPKDQRAALDGAKALTDLWVNLWSLSAVTLLLYLVGACSTGHLAAWGIPVGALLTFWLAAGMTKSAALDWGAEIKSCFDVFLPELRAKLGLPAGPTRQEERQRWLQWSQAAGYRASDSLPDLVVSPDMSLGEGAESAVRGVSDC